MAELSHLRAGKTEPPIASAEQIGKANKHMLDLLFGAQQVLLEEIVFLADEWFDRARTETHLFAEIVSKLASAHSVNNMRTMYEECGQHQIDFIRRDCERLFKHSRRMIDRVSNLIGEPSNG